MPEGCGTAEIPAAAENSSAAFTPVAGDPFADVGGTIPQLDPRVLATLEVFDGVRVDQPDFAQIQHELALRRLLGQQALQFGLCLRVDAPAHEIEDP